MIVAESYPLANSAPRSHALGLLDAHQSKISLHRASAEYRYPTIRLPHYLAKSLVGLPTRIYQIVHDGALASLVVVSSGRRENAERSEHADVNQKRLDLHTAKVGRSNRLETICFWVL